MRLYEVSIDNDPGGWKSGYDAHVLVLANSPKEAEDKVRNKWCYIWYQKESEGDNRSILVQEYGFFKKDDEHQGSIFETHFYEKSTIHAKEIKFKDYEFIPVREAKLKRINKEK